MHDGSIPGAGEAPFWNAGTGEILASIQSRAEGLTKAEAEERLARFGPNLATANGHRSLLAKLGRKLGEPLVAILLIAAALSGATGDWRSFVVIAFIVLASTALDIVQEQKAETAVDALKRSVAVTAAVRRDGMAAQLPVRDIVPGDVIELRGGDVVPADGIVLSARGALANEALLTGEPYPAEKRPGPCPARSPAEAFNALFSGTSIVGGEAVMLAVATGSATRFGAITASLQEQAAPTAFERGVHALGMLILRITGFLVLFVLLTRLAFHDLSIDTFLFAIALAVGLTPELLPMIMTVTLSRGALRMAKQQVVVKRLSAIHDLGAMDILCTDKTGTLTEARITLVDSIGPDGAKRPHVADLARLNSRFASGVRSNLDDAILDGAPADTDGWTVLDELPFDFDRRRASVLVAQGARRQLITKGAPEALLALCTKVERDDGTTAPLTDAERATIAATADEKGRAGLRLLGLAWRLFEPGTEKVSLSDESDLVFAGYVAFADPPKTSASEAVARLEKARVRVKIVSGDAEPVVRHVVEALGLPAKGVMSGEEIADASDAELAARAGETDLFIRVSPSQKSRIVRALQHRGHTVGFLGDGINDAPAIHAADVGLSVEGGTDVARLAADIILLAPDLSVLANGVREGRRTYANIMKYIRMGTSSNFGNMLSMALAALVLPFLPLAPLQVLLNNLVYDLSEIGLPFDAADERELTEPRAWDIRSILHFTLIMGPLSSVFDLATFALLHLGFATDIATFRTAWFVESITSQVLVIFVIRTAHPFWKSHPHPILTATSLGALAAALLLALTPAGAVVGFVPLPPAILATMLGVSAVYLVMAEMLKRYAADAPRRRRYRR